MTTVGPTAKPQLKGHNRVVEPHRVLPVAGGTLAVVVGVLWYTSAVWYYDGFRLPGL
jgi:hypothetical protein